MDRGIHALLTCVCHLLLDKIERKIQQCYTLSLNVSTNRGIMQKLKGSYSASKWDLTQITLLDS